MHLYRSLLVRLLVVGAVACLPSRVAAQSWTTLINDEFIGADGTSLVNHTPETNLPAGTWSMGGSPGLILQGEAVRPSGAGPFQAFATIDARVSDGDIGLYWWPVPQGDNSSLAGGLIFRYVDQNNFMLVHYWQQRVWLWKMVAGSLVHIAYADVAPAQGSAYHWMAVRAIGSSLAVNWDGVDVITLNDSTYQTATRHGVWFRNVADYQSYISMFRVRSQSPMQPPAVTNVVASPNPLSMPIASISTVTATAYAATGATIPTATYSWASSNPSVAWVQSTTSNTANIVATSVGTTTLTVTGQSGTSSYQRTVPITVTNTTAQAKQVLIYDDFIAAENSSLADHAPETNLSHGTWAVGGSPSLIINNQAVHPNGTGSFDAYATIDSKTPDADVGIYWHPSSSATQPAGGVIFRWVSPTSYLLAHYWQNYLQLWRMTPTGFVLVSNVNLGAPTDAWHWLEIRGIGASVTVNWDGVDRIQVTDATNLLSTRHGIWSWSNVDPYSTIGTFVVKGTLPEPVTSVVLTPTAATIPVGGAQVLSAKGYGAGGTYVPGATFSFAVNVPNAEIVSLQSPSTNTVKAVGFFTGSVPVTATATNGGTGNASATITVTEKCMGLCVADTFSGAAVPLQSHPPDIANVMDGPWEVVGGPAISAGYNAIKPTATGGTIAIGTINGGNNNGSIQADWHPDTSLQNPTFGLIARYVSNNEYYLATYENRQIKLFKRYDNGITQIGGAFTYDDLTAQHRMTVKLDGPGITVLWDNVIKIQAVDAAYESATRHGVYFDVSKDSTSSLTTFQFVGGAKSVPATVQITQPSPTIRQAYGNQIIAKAYTAANDWIHWTSFTWHSSNSAVASVESDGINSAWIVGLSSGTADITATSTEGVTTTYHILITTDESDGTVSVFDTFDGAMSTPLSSHEPNRHPAGATWSTIGADGIRLNDLNEIYPLVHSEYEIGTIESGTADGTVSAVWRPYNDNQYANGGIIFRYVNETSYWYARMIGRSLELRRVTSEGHVTVASVGTGNPTGMRLQIAVLLDGPRIQVWLNGMLQLQFTDGMNELATRHGVIFHSAFNGESSLDDFSVNSQFITPVLPPQPVVQCRAGAWPPSGASWLAVGGTDTATISGGADCVWHAESTVPWIHLVQTSGIGETYLDYSVDLNTGGPRAGAIVINGGSWPVSQSAGGTLAVTLQVLDSSTQMPVSGALVFTTPDYGGFGAESTGNDGRVSYVMTGGPLEYEIHRQGYLPKIGSFQVTQADTKYIYMEAGGEEGSGGPDPSRTTGEVLTDFDGPVNYSESAGTTQPTVVVECVGQSHSENGVDEPFRMWLQVGLNIYGPQDFTGTGTLRVKLAKTVQDRTATCRWHSGHRDDIWTFTVVGTGGATLTGCSAPESEVVSSLGWEPDVQSVHKFLQRLQSPDGISFSGRTIWEHDDPGAFDSCYFTGSEYEPADKLLPVGSKWQVESNNTYGPDSVGWNPLVAFYYQEQRRVRGKPMPCESSTPQRMSISCPSGGEQTFAHHVLRTIIEPARIGVAKDLLLFWQSWQ